MSAAPRVVLDTNVVLSALVFAGGKLARVRHAWQEKRFEPLVSEATADELARAVGYPEFKLTAGEQHELLGGFLAYCAVVLIPAKPPKVPKCRDPSDAPFLHLAVKGHADYLVTGDKDLLAIAPQFECPIITPVQFMERCCR